jgi:hypothetical protein
MVTTDDEAPPAVLVLAVDIPKTVQIDPELVYWKIGEAPSPKVIHISVNRDTPVQITGVESDNPSVQLTVHTTEPGKALDVEVKPADTSHPESSVLLVRTDYPPDNPQTHFAYARVQ